jgi:hypothetical protein
MEKKSRSRKQAIRNKCIDCCGGVRAEVRKCSATNCPLWPFRMGAEIKDTGEDDPMEDLEAGEAVGDI